MSTDLSAYNNSWYSPGRPRWIQALWFFVGLPILRAKWIPYSSLRCWLLRSFGSRIGKGVIIKPGVQIKYPWLLEIEDHSWIGEHVWIDNLALVHIQSNVCISQGAYLCTGNHDWSDPAFGLLIQPITILESAWIGAKVIICPGVEVGAGAVATAGSVVTQSLHALMIYSGNPAKAIKSRVIRGPLINVDSVST